MQVWLRQLNMRVRPCLTCCFQQEAPNEARGRAAWAHIHADSLCRFRQDSAESVLNHSSSPDKKGLLQIYNITTQQLACFGFAGR